MAHAIPKLIAVAVVRHGDKFLVGPRPAGVPLAGFWEFPGGKVEPFESPADAAVRECREETGLNVRVVAEYPPADFDYSHGSLHLRFFDCVIAQECDSPSLPFVWVERQRLAQLAFPPANAPLLSWLEANSPSAANSSLPSSFDSRSQPS